MEVQHNPLKSLNGGTSKIKEKCESSKSLVKEFHIPPITSTVLFEESIRSLIKKKQPVSILDIIPAINVNIRVIKTCIQNLETAGLIKVVYVRNKLKYYVSINWKEIYR